MKYYIIAGEPSGDLHGSNLMKELTKLDPNASFRCWGGEKMEEAGGVVVKHFRELAFMGFWEVLLNLRTILANLSFCKRDLVRFAPDVLILIDYPGFNLRIAEFASKAGFRVFYYISPQVWAWKANRVKKIKKHVERMFVILPFEKAFYQEWDYHVDYVGHPLIDALESRRPFSGLRQTNGLDDRPIIALLPGSRKQEISKILPAMVAIRSDFENHQLVVAGLSHLGKAFYHSVMGSKDIPVVLDQTYDLVAQAELALVTSGTATLETALLGTPEVICYRGSWLSYVIGRRLVRVKYIALVNLILDEAAVPELIQDNLNRDALRTAMRELLDNNNRDKLVQKYAQLKEMLGGTGASEKTARLIINYLEPGQSSI